MHTINDIHRQFAEYFKHPDLKPFAYLLSQRMQEGHICVDVFEANKFSASIPYPAPYYAEKLKEIPALVGTTVDDLKPFIVYQDKLYLHRYFTYETMVLKSIGKLLKEEATEKDQRQEALQTIKELVGSFQADDDIKLLPPNEQIDWQLAAAIQGVLHNFTIITGGPGTGKTTTVAKLLSLLFTINPNYTIALAAPTGKAAMRMAESLSQTKLPLTPAVREKFSALHPNTLHRLLKYDPNSVNFKYNKNNPLPYDVIIVDESSMIDVALFAKLLSAVHKTTRLILLGDKHQLAAVEAGSLFGDLCNAQNASNSINASTASYINSFIQDKARKISDHYIQTSLHPLVNHIIELQRSHRFNSIGGIGKFSKAILQNDGEALNDFLIDSTNTTVKIDTLFDVQLFENFIQGYQDFIQETNIVEALNKLNLLRVLCAVREGEQGLYKTNAFIESYLKQKGLIKLDNTFYENRPIIITKNYPELKLFNGDIGIVRKDTNGNLRAWFLDSDNTLHAILPAYIADAETVFAMTIHKSQGSEYDHAWVILPQQSGNPLLTRELLYTAVTRAKKSVVVQTSAAILFETTANTVKRASGITDRFQEIC
jgi:exodeoxyribonuclease V alpha subunit